MRPHIIAGYDGSTGGRDALAFALVLLDADVERAQELTVVAVPSSARRGLRPPRRGAVTERTAADRAEQQLRGARDAVGSRRHVSFSVRPDASPARALQLVATQYAPATIVVGRSHVGPIGTTFESSVTEATLRGAPCPVFVSPAGYGRWDGPRRLDAITVALDGSPPSLCALAFADDLARSHGAALRLVRVLEPELEGRGGLEERTASRRSEAFTELRRLSAERRTPTLEPSVAMGDPVAVLGSPGPGTDLLVVGTRGVGSLGPLPLGSVASKLVRTSTVPVVVVPQAVANMSSTARAHLANATA